MRILLVEDDKKLSQALCYLLEENHYMVDVCYDGEEASFYMKEGIYDCILLDRMLPLMDGTQLLSQLRSRKIKTPVIMITALDTLQDKITGLDCGADDYLVKPFEFAELEARIRSVIRRCGAEYDESELSFSDIRYDSQSLCLTGPSSSLTLSKKEGNVLSAFLLSQGKTLSREALQLKVWGIDSEVEASNLDNYIHFLRRRLKTVGSLVKLVNVWGVGYRMESGE